MMNIHLDSLIMLLCCCQLEAYQEASVSPEEWEAVEKIIKSHGLKGPTSLLGMHHDEWVDVLGMEAFCAYKISQRIKTMHLFVKALSDIAEQGILVVTKYDDNYPQILLQKMKKRAPLYIFYSGDITLVKEGISIAGLVEVSKKERMHIKKLVDKAKEEQLLFLSNDTRGVDEIAFRYALQQQCVSACFVCHDFTTKQKEYRRYIKTKQLVLLTTVDPSKHFTVTNAIDRNGYVCGLSTFQIIISSKINNGATWFTALQNMHQRWTVSFVIDNNTVGNLRLLDMGAVPLTTKDILSGHSFDMIYNRNKKVLEENLVHVNQMSIFEFIGEENEDRI